MSDRINKHIQEKVSGLELLEKYNILNVNEKRAVIRKRKLYETRLQKGSLPKEDIMKYIHYEMDLMKLIKRRLQEKNLQQKEINLEYTVGNRINELFTIAIHRFPKDNKIWCFFIKFFKQIGAEGCISIMFDQILEVHKDLPGLYKLAAQWEFENCGSIERARKFIHQGLHTHKNSKLLYTEGFRFELAHAKLIKDGKGEKSSTGSDIDLSYKEKVLKGKFAEVFYDSGVKKISDVIFLKGLLNIAQEFPFISSLPDKIIKEMSTKYPNEEITWDTQARRELDLNGTLRERIEKCISVYETGLKNVPTRKMWSMYLDYVIELNEDQANLQNFKKNCLKTAMAAANRKNMLSENHYLIWIKKVENVDPGDILQWATERLDTSSKLWSWRLHFHLNNEDDESALTVFKEIISNPNIPDQATLWMVILKYYQLSDSFKAEQLWKDAVNNPIVGSKLKGRYIEWLAVSRGIVAARNAYKNIANLPPYSLDLHVAMSKMEDAQPKLSLKNMRNIFDNASNQLGDSNTDIWIWYVKFEDKFGDPEKVHIIYERAMKKLKSHLVNNFVSEYHLNKAATMNINRYFGLNEPNENDEDSSLVEDITLQSQSSSAEEVISPPTDRKHSCSSSRQSGAIKKFKSENSVISLDEVCKIE